MPPSLVLRVQVRARHAARTGGGSQEIFISKRPKYIKNITKTDRYRDQAWNVSVCENHTIKGFFDVVGMLEKPVQLRLVASPTGPGAALRRVSIATDSDLS
jgi:hypothetical protein